jgi:hypothetical protein
MTGQLANISKTRLFHRADILSQEDMPRIEEALKIQLDIHRNWPSIYHHGR